MAKTLHAPVCFLVLLSICCASRAQESSAGPVVGIIPRAAQRVPAIAGSIPEVNIRVDTSLVLVPVQATSLRGSSITDLVEANFRLFEDGVEQKIVYFSKQDAPLSVGLVFDASGSMTNKIHRSADAAAAFFKTANAADEFFLVEFGDKPKLQMPFTSNSDEIYKKIMQTKAFGRTSLIDAIHLALVQMKNARNPRKAIVILSDGGDNRSRLTRAEIKDALLESSVQIYAMGIFDPEGLARHTAEEENGPRLLGELAGQTGGRLYSVDNLDDLETTSAQIGNALRNEYLLGYAPSNPSRDGKYRHVTVKVSREAPLNVSYRRGYYAPTQ